MFYQRGMCCQRTVCSQNPICTGATDTRMGEQPIKFNEENFPKLYPLFNCAVNEQCVGVSYNLGYVLCITPKECCDVSYCILAEANVPGPNNCPYYVIICITYNGATKCATVDSIKKVDEMAILAETLGWCPSICNC